MLLTLALGLASVPFYRMLHERWTEIRIDAPRVESSTPIIVTPYDLTKDSTITQNRDLSLYEFGGYYPYGCRYIVENRKCEANLKKGRDFVWKNWNAKKQSYFIVDGKYHIFIEPDKNSEWHIAVRSVRSSYAWGDWIEEIDTRYLDFNRDLENGKKLSLYFADWEGKIMFYL